MNLELPTIYPITDVRLSGLSHTEQAKRMIDGGAGIIQFREKYAAPVEWLDDLRDAVELCRRNHVISIVNDRVDLALAVGADGVHLGQTDLPPDAARRLLGADAIIGHSTHSISQVNSALQYDIDYLAFGPIFATMTKKDADAVVGLELLRQVRETSPELPLVGIGGIDIENVRSVLDAGADSVALISAIIGEGSLIVEQMQKFTTQTA